MHLERPSLQAIEMACGKRGRSCGLAAFGDASDSAPLRKLACTLFNQGLRRRVSPVGHGLQGCAGGVEVAPALAEDCGHETCRSEACGLFNGALHQHHGAPAASPCLHLLVDGQVHGSTVTEMAAQRRRIAGRFAVQGEVGRGAFGVVVRAWDTASQAPVAIKIVRKGGRHHLDAVMEAEKLEILRWRDREHKFCVCFKSVCDYQGHVCLVTELLGSTLLSALRDLRVQGSSGVRMETARRVAVQLCEALEFLRRSRLIHADLKTENICLAQPGVACACIPAFFTVLSLLLSSYFLREIGCTLSHLLVVVLPVVFAVVWRTSSRVRACTSCLRLYAPVVQKAEKEKKGKKKNLKDIVCPVVQKARARSFQLGFYSSIYPGCEARAPSCSLFLLRSFLHALQCLAMPKP